MVMKYVRLEKPEPGYEGKIMKGLWGGVIDEERDIYLTFISVAPGEDYMAADLWIQENLLRIKGIKSIKYYDNSDVDIKIDVSSVNLPKGCEISENELHDIIKQVLKEYGTGGSKVQNLKDFNLKFSSNWYFKTDEIFKPRKPHYKEVKANLESK